MHKEQKRKKGNKIERKKALASNFDMSAQTQEKEKSSGFMMTFLFPYGFVCYSYSCKVTERYYRTGRCW